MSEFIGENLTEQEVAALQAVADACGGAQFAPVGDVYMIAAMNPPRFREIVTVNVEESVALLDRLIDKLVADGLVERREIKGKPHIGLTDDGRRRNHIWVMG